LRWRSFRVTIDVDHDEVAYTLRDGAERTLTIRHAGADLELSTAAPRTVQLKPRKPLLPAPSQPPGRTPQRRQR
jgi:hypothetical protein